MKRINNLYEQIYDIDNLRLAHQRAQKNKQNTYGVKVFLRDPEAKLRELQMMLINEEYRTSEYSVFTIKEPKERTIYRLPYFPDRICHHAVMNIMEPIWVSVFTRDTYSCIKTRGIHACFRAVKQDLKADPAGTEYCLKFDIRKFYESIDHDILKTIIRKKIKDVRLLKLLDEIIDSATGVPIGNYLSQYFANLYLAYFDHWIKEEKQIAYYYRYADDIVILHSSKEFLHSLFVEIRAYLTDNLKLSIKGNYQVFPVESRSIDFVGYRFYHTHTLLRKSIKRRLCKAYKKKNNELSKASYYGWAVHCNSKNLLKKVNNAKI